MASIGMARISAPDSEKTIARQQINAELNRAFDLVNSATFSRHAQDTFDSDQSIRNARTACETITTLLTELPVEHSAGLQMRLDALQSILFDLSNESSRAMYAPGTH